MLYENEASCSSLNSTRVMEHVLFIEWKRNKRGCKVVALGRSIASIIHLLSAFFF